jgi:histone H3/H4
MSVELPFAPVDEVIRHNAGDLRVSSGATETLASHIQREGAEQAVVAAERAETDGRKTLMVADFDAASTPPTEELALPIAPVDRVARLDIDDRYRVSMDARVALAAQLEAYADDIATVAARLARHAGRRTVKAEDIELYDELAPHFT